jgi:hypothetical protein
MQRYRLADCDASICMNNTGATTTTGNLADRMPAWALGTRDAVTQAT